MVNGGQSQAQAAWLISTHLPIGRDGNPSAAASECANGSRHKTSGNLEAFLAKRNARCVGAVFPNPTATFTWQQAPLVAAIHITRDAVAPPSIRSLARFQGWVCDMMMMCVNKTKKLASCDRKQELCFQPAPANRLVLFEGGAGATSYPSIPGPSFSCSYSGPCAHRLLEMGYPGDDIAIECRIFAPQIALRAVGLHALQRITSRPSSCTSVAELKVRREE